MEVDQFKRQSAWGLFDYIMDLILASTALAFLLNWFFKDASAESTSDCEFEDVGINVSFTDIDARMKEYLLASTETQTSIEQDMASSSCRVRWPLDEDSDIVLAYNESTGTGASSTETQTENIKRIFLGTLQKYISSVSMQLDQISFEIMKDKLNLSDQQGVARAGQVHYIPENQLCIVGSSAYISATIQNVLQFQSERHTTVIPLPCQKWMGLLEKNRVMSTIEEEFSNVEFTFTQFGLQLKGGKHFVNLAEEKAKKALDKIVLSEITILSKILTDIISRPVVSESINKKLEEAGIQSVTYIQGSQCFLASMGLSEADKALHELRFNLTKETTIEIDPKVAKLSRWKESIIQLLTSSKDAVAIQINNECDRVTIYGMGTEVEAVEGKIADIVSTLLVEKVIVIPIVLKSDYIKKFLMASEHTRAAIDTEMEENDCYIKWPLENEDQIEVIYTYIGNQCEHENPVSENIKKMFLASMERFVAFENVTVEQTLMDMVEDEILKADPNIDQQVGSVLFGPGSEISIVGEHEYVGRMYARTHQTQAKVDLDSQTLTTVVLFPGPSALALAKTNVMNMLEVEIPDVHFILTQTGIHISGDKQSVENAKGKTEEIVKKIYTSEVHLSADIFRNVISKAEIMAEINERFSESNMESVFSYQNSACHITSLSKESFTRALQYLTDDLTKETTVDIDPKVAKMSHWIEQINQVMSNCAKSVSIQFHNTNHSVRIYGMSPAVNLLETKINAIIDDLKTENTIHVPIALDCDYIEEFLMISEKTRSTINLEMGKNVSSIKWPTEKGEDIVVIHTSSSHNDEDEEIIKSNLKKRFSATVANCVSSESVNLTEFLFDRIKAKILSAEENRDPQEGSVHFGPGYRICIVGEHGYVRKTFAMTLQIQADLENESKTLINLVPVNDPSLLTLLEKTYVIEKLKTDNPDVRFTLTRTGVQLSGGRQDVETAEEETIKKVEETCTADVNSLSKMLEDVISKPQVLEAINQSFSESEMSSILSYHNGACHITSLNREKCTIATQYLLNVLTKETAVKIDAKVARMSCWMRQLNELLSNLADSVALQINHSTHVVTICGLSPGVQDVERQINDTLSELRIEKSIHIPITLDSRYVKEFLAASETTRKTIEDEMAKNLCLIKWPSDKNDQIDIVYTFTGDHYEDNKVVKENMNKIFSSTLASCVASETLTISEALFERIKEKLLMANHDNDSQEGSVLSGPGCQISIVGGRSYVSKTYAMALQIQAEVDEDATMLITIVPVPVSSALILLQKTEVVASLERDFPRVDFTLTQTGIQLFGEKLPVACAEEKTKEEVGKIYTTEIDNLSEALHSVISKPQIMEEINERFAKSEMESVLSYLTTACHVTSLTKEKCQKALQYLRDVIVKEATVKIDPNVAKLPRKIANVYQLLTTCEHSSAIQINEDNLTVEISGIAPRVSDLEDKVRDILSDELENPRKIPIPDKDVNTQTKEFLIGAVHTRKKIEVDMKKSSCNVHWPLEPENPVELEYPVTGYYDAHGNITEVNLIRIFISTLEQYVAIEELVIGYQFFDKVKDKINEAEPNEDPQVGCVYFQQRSTIMIVGERSYVSDMYVKTLNIQAEIERNSMTVITFVPVTTPSLMTLLEHHPFTRKLKQDFPHIQITMTHAGIQLKGDRLSVEKAERAAMDIVEDTHTTEITNLTDTLSTVISKPKVIGIINQKFAVAEIPSILFSYNNICSIASLSHYHSYLALQELERLTTEITVDIDPGVAKLESWNKSIIKLCSVSDLVSVDFSETDNKVRISGVLEEVSVRRLHLYNILAGLERQEFQYQISTAMAKVLEIDTGWKGRFSCYGDNMFMLTVNTSIPSIHVGCTKATLPDIIEEITSLTREFTVDELLVKKIGIHKYFSGQKIAELARFNRTYIDVDNTDTRKEKQDPEKHFSSLIGNKCRLHIVPSNPKSQQADVMVNLKKDGEDNDSLFAGAMEREFISKKKCGMSISNIVVTHSHGLPYKKVYHATCKSIKNDKISTLSKLLTDCLKLAEWSDWNSIAFSVSAVMRMGISSQQACSLIFNAVKDGSDMLDSIETVFAMVGEDEHLYEEMCITTAISKEIAELSTILMSSFSQHLETFLSVINQPDVVPKEETDDSDDDNQERRKTGEEEEEESEGEADLSKKERENGEWRAEFILPEEEYDATEECITQESIANEDGSNLHGMVDEGIEKCCISFPNGTELSLVDGSISDQQADVLVNSVGGTNLNQGEISRFLLGKAGTGLQDELNESGQTLNVGEVAETRGHQLNNKRIYHVNPGDNGPEEVMVKLVETCLGKVCAAGFDSIAFPSIGTGGFGWPPEVVARLTLRCIKQLDDKGGKPIHVSIVFPDYGSEKFQCYMTEMEKCEGFLETGVPHSYKNSADVAPEHSVENKVPSQKGTVESTTSADMPSLSPPEAVPLVFKVYGLRKSDVEDTIARIQGMVDEKFRVHYFDDPSLESMDYSALCDIENLAHSKGVKATVVKSTKQRMIRLEGFVDDVGPVTSAIQKMCREKDTMIASKLAELIQVRWEYDRGSGLTSFSTTENGVIEKEFNLKRRELQITTDGEKLALSLKNMTASTWSGHTFPIYRRSLDLPPNWFPQDTKDVEFYNLDPESAEYKQVTSAFVSGVKAAKILQIQRIQNPMLYRMYSSLKDRLMKTLPSDVTIEGKLWHGTVKESIESISRNCFDRGYGGKNATLFGHGVYFAVGSEYSAKDTYSRKDSDGNKYVYYVRVLVGRYTRGNSTWMFTPPVDEANPAIKYDSLVDNNKKPSMFIVFNDSQAYPDYLIKFKIN